MSRARNGKPVKITSWDRDTSSPDKLTNDGRAYIRSLGGQSASGTPNCRISASGAAAPAVCR